MDEVAPTRHRRAIGWLVTAAMLLAAASISLSQVQSARAGVTPSEYEVKAAFLLNFTKFIEWPAETQMADSPFTVCVLGDDPFGPVLDQIVDGERVGRRNIVVRRVREPESACEILFIGKSERGAARALAGVARGVLTVGETDDFLRQGGAISFVVDSRRVRFDVSERAATRSGLKISSRLLNVARLVER